MNGFVTQAYSLGPLVLGNVGRSLSGEINVRFLCGRFG